MNCKCSVALAGVLSLTGGPLWAGDLTDTVRKAIVYNPDVLVTQDDRRAIEQNVREAKAGYLPRVDVNAGIGGEKSDNTSTLGATGRQGYLGLHREESGIRITQMLFDGFFTRQEVARQTATLQAASYRVRAAAEDVGLRATQTYLDVLRRREQVELARDNLAAHQRVFDQIRMRSERGVGRVADTDQAGGRLALAKALIERYAENDARILDEIFARGDDLSEDPLQAFLIGLKLFAETMADVREAHPGCLAASFCYQEQLFDAEVRALSRESFLRWRKRFASHSTPR